jgi:3-dehydroquinate synthase
MRLNVELGARTYPVVISTEGLGALGAEIRDTLGAPSWVVVVSNDRVWPIYGDAVKASLLAAGIDLMLVVLPDGEAQKCAASWVGLTESILALGVDRSTPIVAVGGGVIGDLAGFAAATIMRGLPFVQVPTTLLSMVDSSVGGKTGINTARGKNLLGAFHQPSLVFAALNTLSTLDEQDFLSGMGEVVKHGLIGDSVLFSICAEQSTEILARNPSLIAELVARSVSLKAKIVASDEREEGLRAVLNLGHTVGHAIETTLLGTEAPLSHGLCVGIGCLAEVRWAEARGDCVAGVGRRLAAALTALGMPVEPPMLDVEAVLRAVKFDKKGHRGKLRTAVVVDVGRVRLTEIDFAEIPTLFHSLLGFSK